MTTLAVLVLAATSIEAVPNLDRVIATQLEEVTARPGDPAVHNDLGNLLVLADRMDEAESAYRKAKDLSPQDASARFNLGLLFQQQERYDEAHDELSDLIEIEPDHAWAHYQLGMLESSRGHRKKALDFYAQSFALDPTLSFERNNPHIIDNELAMEALLLSSQFRRSAASSIPRSYGEGARLREVMLEEAEAEMAAEMEAEMAAEDKDGEGDRRGPGTASSSAGTTGTGSSLSSRGGGSTGEDLELPRGRDRRSYGDDEGVDDEAEPAIRGGVAAGVAVGTPVGGAQEGEAVRPAAPSSAAPARPSGVDEQSRRDAIRERLRGRTTSESPRTPSSREVTTAPDRPAPAPAPSYRPSRRSSASLELELLDDGGAGARGTK
ncbi:MAG: tetratricopeptide repeat protein [Acidobacteriota bacterium]